MSDCALHDFDLLLCSQAIWNVRLQLGVPQVRESVDRLPEPLTTMLIDKVSLNLHVAPIPGVILSSEEFCQIADSVRYLPFEVSADWCPLVPQYRMATLCTGEIRRRLAPAEAIKWSNDSLCFASALQQPRLDLADGIGLVDEWTTELRRYLEALAEFRYLPRPDGQFPTPTRPEPGANVEPESPELAYLERMRAAVAKHEDGKQASPNELIKLAHANRRLGRKALRRLEQQGEYRGFGRRSSKSRGYHSK